MTNSAEKIDAQATDAVTEILAKVEMAVPADVRRLMEAVWVAGVAEGIAHSIAELGGVLPDDDGHSRKVRLVV